MRSAGGSNGCRWAVARPRNTARLMTTTRIADHAARAVCLSRVTGWACSERFDDRGGEQRHHDLVMADQRIALPALLGRAAHDIRRRPVVHEEIHVHR